VNTEAPASGFRDRFSNGHVILPVVHVETLAQAEDNTNLALDEGADGVFLINHHIRSDTLLEIHSAVAARFPNAWIGVNCLGLTPALVFAMISERVDGVWVDNAMIDERGGDQSKAQGVLDARERAGNSRALYFGGVAFKYQRHVEDLASAATTAARFMDIVTTSGPGTGQSAHVDKIRVMKEALGSFPLAIASGITPDNVESYLPYADCFLVATGISRSFDQLDAVRLRRLVELVRDCAG
jgi:predicted TIM-barrel enzyme